MEFDVIHVDMRRACSVVVESQRVILAVSQEDFLCETVLAVGAGEVAVKFEIAEAGAGGVRGDAEAVVGRVTDVEFEGVGQVVLGLSL